MKESGRGALLAGGLAGLAGLLAGPVGLALGGAVGGCLAAWLSHGKYKSLPEVILSLKAEDKQRLVEKARSVLTNIGRC